MLELEFSKQYRYAEAIPMSYLRMHLKYREKKSLDNANNYFKQLCVLCIMSSNFMSGILGVDKCQLLIDKQHFIQKIFWGHRDSNQVQQEYTL